MYDSSRGASATLKEPATTVTTARPPVSPSVPRKPEARPVPAVAPAAPDYAYPWTPDQGDGTYRNPVLYADYSDPDGVRVGDDYYLTASSFNCTPGLPILHSRDLVNWTLVNHALRNLPGERFREVQPGCGVWAPAFRVHAGRFWIFFPMPDEGIFVTTADHPEGTWAEPHCVVAGKGLIDPCPLWDDDGKAYLVHAYAHSRSGIKHRLRVVPMAPDGSRLLGEGVIIADGEERFPTLEGPKFLKRDGWYYVLAPAGGVATGWQLALRSRHIYGPYKAHRVLEQGSSPVNGPHQGALLDTAKGDWWFLHFQDAGVYGRIVHLQPVTWRNGWPEMGIDADNNGVGEPVDRYRLPVAGSPVAIPATSDEFDAPTLGLQWQWYANHDDRWYSLTDRPGYLRLFAQPAPASGSLGLTPHLLLQKSPARVFITETAVDLSALAPGESAGLAVVGLRHAALVAESGRNSGECRLRLVIDNETVAESPLPAANDTLRLRVHVADGGWCRFAFADGDAENWTPLGTEFGACEGRWIGAKVGVFATRPRLDAGSSATAGHADFAYFRFAAPAAERL